MARKLSIESIKKELIDKLVNNMDILRYLEIDKNDHIELSQVHNAYIYDYDDPNLIGNYITVDVAEYESSNVNIRDSKKYAVSIKTGLKHSCNLDKVSAIIKEIVLKLYPNIKALNDVPIHVKKNVHTYSNRYSERDELIRMIRFEMEENTTSV